MMQLSHGGEKQREKENMDLTLRLWLNNTRPPARPPPAAQSCVG